MVALATLVALGVAHAARATGTSCTVSGLVLLQRSAHVLETSTNGTNATAESLANTSVLLPTIPPGVFAPANLASGLDAQVAELGKRMEETLRHGAEQLVKKRADFEKKLEQQLRENDALRHANANLTAEIEVAWDVRRKLREGAAKHVRDVRGLVESADVLRKNLTSGADFASGLLVSADRKLQRARELEVLAHSALVASSTNRGSKTVHLLQAAVEGVPSASILKPLDSTLHDAAAKRKAAEAALVAVFDARYKEGAAERAALRKEQMHLNATLHALRKEAAKLVEADKYLRGLGDEIRANISKLADQGREAASLASAALGQKEVGITTNPSKVAQAQQETNATAMATGANASVETINKTNLTKTAGHRTSRGLWGHVLR